jgi:hypothetical protein
MMTQDATRGIEAWLDTWLDGRFSQAARRARETIAQATDPRHVALAHLMLLTCAARAADAPDDFGTRKQFELAQWRNLEYQLCQRHARALVDIDAANTRERHQRAQLVLDYILEMLAAVRSRMLQLSSGAEGHASF